MLDIAASCLVLTALFAYLNHRFIKLPTTIGVMAIAPILSLALFGQGKLGIGKLHQYEAALLSSIDFSEVLLWAALPLVGLGLPFLYCLVFGALISPTDPSAVLGERFNLPGGSWKVLT